MPAPYAGFIILVCEDMISRARENPCKGVPNGLDTLPGLSAYFDGVVHKEKLFRNDEEHFFGQQGR